MIVQKHQINGIWVRETKKFYWLDTGPVTVNAPQHKLLSSLTARGLIDLPPDGKVKRGFEPYVLMPYVEAEEKGYEIERVPINAHVAKNPSSFKERPVSTFWSND